MSTTFSVTAQQIIRQALLTQGWLDYTTVTIDATKYADMQLALNIMIKAWSSRGLKLWTIEELVFQMVNGQTTYDIGPGAVAAPGNRPLRIEQAFLRLQLPPNSNDIPLTAMSRNEYELLGNKFSLGTPSSFFYDPQIPLGFISFYPTPNQFAQLNYAPHLFIRQDLQDVVMLTDTMQFPSEWYQALYYGLAAETWLMNQVPARVGSAIEAKAAYFVDQMEAWDREWVPVSFGLDYQGQSYDAS